MDPKAELEKLDRLAGWLDDRFRIPGTNIRFGLDSIIGLVPGVGDGVSAIPAAYLIMRARACGAPLTLILRMCANMLIDLAIGAIPLLGDIFDFGFKANRRNIDLLRDYLKSQA